MKCHMLIYGQWNMFRFMAMAQLSISVCSFGIAFFNLMIQKIIIPI